MLLERYRNAHAYLFSHKIFFCENNFVSTEVLNHKALSPPSLFKQRIKASRMPSYCDSLP